MRQFITKGQACDWASGRDKLEKAIRDTAEERIGLRYPFEIGGLWRRDCLRDSEAAGFREQISLQRKAFRGIIN